MKKNKTQVNTVHKQRAKTLAVVRKVDMKKSITLFKEKNTDTGGFYCLLSTFREIFAFLAAKCTSASTEWLLIVSVYHLMRIM